MTEPKANGFIKLDRAVVRSEAWQALSGDARALLIEIWDQHNGRNNGQLRYSIAQAQRTLHCSTRTARRRFRELEEAGLIECTERGSFAIKAGRRKGTSSAWRITLIGR